MNSLFDDEDDNDVDDDDVDDNYGDDDDDQEAGWNVINIQLQVWHWICRANEELLGRGA